MSKVNNFDVLKRMGERNDDIRLCTTITEMTYNMKKGGTEVVIGVPGNVCFEIEQGKLSVCLLLFNKREFDELKRSMAMEHEGVTEQDIAETMPPRQGH